MMAAERRQLKISWVPCLRNFEHLSLSIAWLFCEINLVLVCGVLGFSLHCWLHRSMEWTSAANLN